jgi:2-iminobutanoate/2-iminopropanoate deaminase
MIREIIGAEPLSTYLEALEGANVRSYSPRGRDLCVGLPLFDPKTGQVVDAPIERQTELVLEQLKLCVEATG